MFIKPTVGVVLLKTAELKLVPGKYVIIQAKPCVFCGKTSDLICSLRLAVVFMHYDVSALLQMQCGQCNCNGTSRTVGMESDKLWLCCGSRGTASI